MIQSRCRGLSILTLSLQSHRDPAQWRHSRRSPSSDQAQHAAISSPSVLSSEEPGCPDEGRHQPALHHHYIIVIVTSMGVYTVEIPNLKIPNSDVLLCNKR